MSAELFFSLEEYQERLSRAWSFMSQAGVDVIIVSDPSNMNWLTGYDGWSFYVHQAVILPLGGVPIWWGRGMDAKGALRTVWMFCCHRDRHRGVSHSGSRRAPLPSPQWSLRSPPVSQR